jgi:hypothetical protein
MKSKSNKPNWNQLLIFCKSFSMKLCIYFLRERGSDSEVPSILKREVVTSFFYTHYKYPTFDKNNQWQLTKQTMSNWLEGDVSQKGR